MKKRSFLILAAAFTAAFSMTAYAGEWQSSENGWWYAKDDGTWPVSAWEWLDGNGDGVSECYYFDENGYLLTNGTAPDGSQVNGDGAWVVDGQVQTKTVEPGGPGGGSGEDWSSEDAYYDDSWNSWGFYDPWYYDPYWYDSDPYLSEGDKAAYHYAAHYWKYPDNYELVQQVWTQYERIAANPSNETASQEMVWVEVPVWRLSGGQKVPGTDRVQVMSSIADDVKAIFTEIYNGPEQFPINSLGGYSWRSNGLTSNHSAGLAIDINPDQNPQVRADGTVLVGSKWEPGVNPYSISRDSDVVKAFGAHGWNWGAAFSTKDYMHFDFYSY